MSDIRLSIDFTDGTLTRSEYYKWRAHRGEAPVPHRAPTGDYSIPGEAPWSGLPRLSEFQHGGEMLHGTYSGYTHFKCRCPDCREAARRFQKERRARLRRATNPSAMHGSGNPQVSTDTPKTDNKGLCP